MNLFNLIATTVLITVSGALAPGPLFFITLSHGVKFGAKSGLVFSIAHSLVEFILIMSLSFGLLTLVNTPLVKITTGVTGGAALLIFGGAQIRNAIKFRFDKIVYKEFRTRNLFLMGLAFTGLNPFFVVWWLTVGTNLIILALQFASLLGVILMYVSHVWIDYVWLTLVAHVAKFGTNIVGSEWYRIIVAVFGMILLYFGLLFLSDSLAVLIFSAS